MALPQQKFREIVFQLLYSQDMASAEEEDMMPFMMHQLAVSKKAVREAFERKNLVKSKQEEIDRLVGEVAVAYDFERITRVERNILRLAAFELLYDALIPPKVAIAEAIRLSRKFATPEGASFVNAILDALYQKKNELSFSSSTR